MTAAATPHAGALAQRVVLVCGAAGGLGSAAAMACAQAGATVVLLGHKPARLNRVYDAIAAVGAQPLLYPLDLLGATPEDYATLAERLQAELGRLDGLLHCAADFVGLTPFEHADPAQFARAIHINLTAPGWLTQACLPLLKQAADAAIVFALDDPARVGQAYWGGYGVAQHGRRGLLATLHGELAASTVRVAGLQPGPMRSALRARAYTHQEDLDAVDPAHYAAACVELLAPAGAAHRGAIWNPLA
ncbi:short-chain dehydrogenase [Xanthomonas translucens pv. arrhenatheri]|uniref:Short-chain dehydrogenase/reductase n=2 Tax=Xanthomonas translucens group TaxID=3390202 RepID=A0A0K2ZE37_9XANT|nr:SDR family NAD(P)-dependent oxidoreductase [Xanthomonas translucens]OAX64760.1 short-chain dehydrogenase [Xanthomonas translucens pv. arrhenatheri]UKE79056.1 SDR family NAD(P)-dependent oxidoreductase [Xanthomonas translucens pv. arrhenatheri]CTP83886.1 short-chain dehydrogenase/reductase [Xanthomonas translucens pv. arrhenatheri LMG 727]